eukprot:13360128-Alexandrium_andersonii.AAC.1
MDALVARCSDQLSIQHSDIDQALGGEQCVSAENVSFCPAPDLVHMQVRVPCKGLARRVLASASAQ